MEATAVDTTARGLLMPSLRLMLLPRLATAMAATAVDMAVMVATATAGATARGRLRLSPAMATVTAVDTAMEATDTARGLLSPAMATGATAMVVTVVVMVVMAAMAAGTTVSYHRIRRSELSQKQNHKNSHFLSCENMKKERNILAQ